jgi:hypothetical protein
MAVKKMNPMKKKTVTKDWLHGQVDFDKAGIDVKG